MLLSYKTIPSPIGTLFIVGNSKAITSLYVGKLELPKDFLKTHTEVKSHNVIDQAIKELQEYFSGTRTTFTISLNPTGTAFQEKAWRELSKIKFGNVLSYGEQAKKMNCPNGQRAVGGANGKNPIPIIIPCHRVVGSTGKLTGFSGGMKMKIWLLKHEGHQVDAEKILLRNL